MRRCAKLTKLPIYPIHPAPFRQTKRYIFNIHSLNRPGGGKIFRGFIKIFLIRLRSPFLLGLATRLHRCGGLSQGFY